MTCAQPGEQVYKLAWNSGGWCRSKGNKLTQTHQPAASTLLRGGISSGRIAGIVAATEISTRNVCKC